MSQSTRIDSFATDVLVLIAIFFLQWMGQGTSVNAICRYFNGDLLKTDAAKDSLKRLKKGGVLTLYRSGRGVIPIYNIEFSQLNTYFSPAVASQSTQYRSLQKLEDLEFVRYQEGKYLFDANRFLDFLKVNGVNIEQSLKILTDIISVLLKRSIPLITEEQFVELIDGNEFVFSEQLISFDEGFLQICQKALCLTTE
ncbi:hypothetical protein G4Y79_01395 [Phototrophicus methaneseepsis]|uniref:Uncharacterized protein n=1 Tax=Phototrophicus methaneseepsis TaxID=2710758 RepID=A0A7S8EA37_9CHLR|nr:hypothetical protein [Phototrophicus methaneseepsis]QPC83059.1 hypothetical protein G4Y79_01395 [Phototrophicus methaneseepsis]